MTATSGDLRAKVREAILHQPSVTHTVLSSLLAVQDVLGYIPEEAADEVALHAKSDVNSVWGVASFYPNFRFTQPGKHIIEVCWGPTCHVLGAQALLKTTIEHLGIAGEGETADKEFTLKFNTCLGCCAHGPAMSFDHKLVGHITPEQARARIDGLKGKPGFLEHQKT